MRRNTPDVGCCIDPLNSGCLKGGVVANVHSEICAIPADRLVTERELLAPLPSLRPEFGAQPTTRKVHKLVLYPVRVRPLLGAEQADRKDGNGACR